MSRPSSVGYRTLKVLAWSCAICTGSLIGVAQTESPSASIREILQQRLGNHPGAGIVVGLLDEHGKRTFIAAGHAGAKATRPLDSRTVFEIGSASKVFTAAILADMVGRGEVALDDPVAKYLPPTVRVPGRVGKPITLLALATHTSGLPRMPNNFAPKDIRNPYADYTVEQLYRFLSGHELTRDVGERFEYSNLGVGLLGHALALSAGMPYEQLMIERIARPLGMRDTRITLDADLTLRLAAGHTATGYPTSNWDIATLAGAGAIRSTAEDMLTFLAAQLAAPGGPLGPAFARTHAARHDAGRPEMQVGLGWMIRRSAGTEIIWHNGGTGGYHSFAGFNPKRRTAVVVLHSSALSIDDVGFHLLDEGFPLDAKTRPLTTPRVEVSPPPSALEPLVGEYALSPTFTLTISREGNQLYLHGTGQPTLPLYAESDTAFFLKAADVQVRFEKSADGRVTGLVLRQDGKDQHAARK